MIIREYCSIQVGSLQQQQARENLRESEERLRTITDTAVDSIFCKDINQRYTFVNPAMLRVFGCTKADLIGKVPEEVFDKENAAIVTEVDERTLNGENVSEVKSLSVAGKPHIFHTIQVPLHDSDGNITGISGIERDITKHKQVEDTLRESELKYRTLFEYSEFLIYITDSKGNILLANSKGADFMGQSQETIVGKSFFGLRPDRAEMYQDVIDKILSTGETLQFETLYPTPGKDKWLFVTVSPLKIENDTRLQIVTQDITTRKQTEETQRESDERFQYLSNASTEAIFFTKDGIGIEANQAAADMFGYSDPADFIGIFGTDIIAPESHELVKEHMLKNLTDLYEAVGKKKDGTLFPIAIRGKTIPYKKNEIVRATSIVDITTRKQADEALRESEERYRSLVENQTELISRFTPDGTFVFVNDAYCHFFEKTKDELVGKKWFPLPVGVDLSLVQEKLQILSPTNPTVFIENRITSGKGDIHWMQFVNIGLFDLDGNLMEIQSVGRDITKQKKMQEELLKTKKLESVGVLAGGIAHDFNNLITSVVGYISLARINMKPGGKAFQNLVKAEKVSIQTKELTARLITFSEGGGPVKETVSIGNLIKDSVDSSLKGSDMDAGFSIPDDISPVEVDEDQMKQVIRNIIINAQEAMAGQGAINVSCESVDIGEKDTLTLKNGKYVKISIEDQGPGIPEEDLINIFDPYFSTRGMGTQKGVGLGLAVSDSVVKNHDGLITVESELGTGTTFVIYLPVSEKEVVEAVPAKKPAPEISVSKGEKILVMDDEAVVREVSNALLTHLGYEVEVAVDGVEAIELYKKTMESEKPFDMVILDLTNKAGMGGAETMVNLLEIDPDVKAIVASGYSNDPVMSNFREHGFRGALPKPFNLDKLKEALHDAITGE